MNFFPTELQGKISKDNYTDVPVNRTISSNMEVGPAKVRRRSHLIIRNVDFTMLLTEEEAVILDNFYLENDALTFYFVNPRNEQQVTARFRDVINFSNSNNLWTANVELEILP